MEWEEVKHQYLREGWSEKTVIYSNEINEKEGWEAKNVRATLFEFMDANFMRETNI